MSESRILKQSPLNKVFVYRDNIAYRETECIRILHYTGDSFGEGDAQTLTLSIAEALDLAGALASIVNETTETFGDTKYD